MNIDVDCCGCSIGPASTPAAADIPGAIPRLPACLTFFPEVFGNFITVFPAVTAVLIPVPITPAAAAD